MREAEIEEAEQRKVQRDSLKRAAKTKVSKISDIIDLDVPTSTTTPATKKSRASSNSRSTFFFRLTVYVNDAKLAANNVHDDERK